MPSLPFHPPLQPSIQRRPTHRLHQVPVSDEDQMRSLMRRRDPCECPEESHRSLDLLQAPHRKNQDHLNSKAKRHLNKWEEHVRSNFVKIYETTMPQISKLAYIPAIALTSDKDKE